MQYQDGDDVNRVEAEARTPNEWLYGAGSQDIGEDLSKTENGVEDEVCHKAAAWGERIRVCKRSSIVLGGAKAEKPHAGNKNTSQNLQKFIKCLLSSRVSLSLYR